MFQLTYDVVDDVTANKLTLAIEEYTNGYYTVIYSGNNCYLKPTNKNPNQRYPNKNMRMAMFYFVRGFMFGNK